MNAYIIVEGSQTEMRVYPAWLGILAPRLLRVDSPAALSNNNYYLFTGGGIPSIYKHISNAVEDINNINAGGKKIDYLLVCLDTEQEDREYILNKIQATLEADGRVINDFQLLVFEHKICMESWFLGNRRVFKSNPQDPDYMRYVRFYNVGTENPELMGNGDEERFTTKAQFHHQYLRLMLRERNMHYAKSNPQTVCSEAYLNELIARYQEADDLKTFGSWYEFVMHKLQP